MAQLQHVSRSLQPHELLKCHCHHTWPVLSQAYTLQRLVRGLASNRQGARQGFALALTTIVQQADGVSVSACVSLMEKLHAVTNSMLVRISTTLGPQQAALKMQCSSLALLVCRWHTSPSSLASHGCMLGTCAGLGGS